MPVHYQITGRRAVAIAGSVEAGVRSGGLPAGATLPPVRMLARELAVSPATVAAAYRSLRQRGVVDTAGRNGTRIRPRSPLAARFAQLTHAPPGTTDLSAGEPDRALLPVMGPRLRRLAATASAPVSYRDSGAWPELVALARDRLNRDGVPVTSGGLTVTSGALDAIERLLTAHLRPGDRVGVEDPGWANLIDLVAALGLTAVPVAIDDEGPLVSSLRQAYAAGVAAVVVTSRAQNPTGAALSPVRAAALRRIVATSPEVLVIEDDHAAELAEVPLACLAGAGARWAFVRSVSKPYGPDLRVAVVAGDEASIARVEGRMRLGAGWVSTLLQRLVVELWRDDNVTALVGRAAAEYARRRSGLVSSLSERGVGAAGRTGINVWVPVRDEPSAVAALLRHSFAVAPGSLYRQAAPPGLRITVARLRVGDADRLADAVADALSPAPALAPAPATGTSR